MLAPEPPEPPPAQIEPAPTPVPAPIPLDPRMFVRTPRQADWNRWLPGPNPRYPILSVKLRCVVGDEGRMESCVVVSEDPPGIGIGAAALKVSGKFQIPAVLNGAPTKGGVIDIPVHMRAPM